LIQLRICLLQFVFLILSGAAFSFATARSFPQGRKETAGPSPTPSQQSVITAPAIVKTHSEYSLPVGQTFVYTGEWRIFNAGIASLRLEQAGGEDHVVGTATATGSVALLYHVQDRYESFFDPASLCSRSTSRHIEEGFRRVDTNIAFDYQHRKVVFDQKNIRKNESKHQEHELTACVTDLLSAVYYVASLPLQPAGFYSFPLNDGGQTLIVNVHVEAREQIKTPAGAFNTIRIRPESATGLLKDKGKFWIWYSDDAARIPVQIRARMSWGTLTLMLLRIEKK
jgi:hypothetical protein